MCRTADLRRAVLAHNDDSAQALREGLAARGAIAVNLLSSPGSGKTALLETELALARERGVPVAALTADLATENDARRLARSGVPVQQVLTDGLCHLEAVMLRGYLAGWLPQDAALLFVENVGNLVCPAAYDLGESLRVVLASVTEGEDKPLKYPTAFGTAQLVLVTKVDLAEPAGFDEAAFLANVARVNPGVEVVCTSARTGLGAGALLDRALAVRAGTPAHRPVMTTPAVAAPHRPPVPDHHHDHDHDHDPDHGDGDGPGHHHDHPAPHHDHDHGRAALDPR
ncbi:MULTISPECIES: hydrogenase nickel incorporation protein HypB [Streptomyces]|uniref:Hydrogenase accessory protein HypB n=1 Tax=Streptomyces tsukubensis (strain DSM 42081 / NBRC 108919 / NRRL 18488 / 9993) TaxID=1114943 RepID=A0A7G3UMW9_STRT9|nr:MULTISPECIES: hydrogenase nickel incorporation protein HypB [Streptomyces]AZK92876.1 hydrogenase accessory protein HypB [Streptomyces tsukubensis]MYS67935.1 hydrogenase nickel incorporation protein HypB [Streptomyces sp. SID5473]QKM70961.1 hydrogenase accessory protein HypB [Streptomyces tsukubensis NRRL18488]TAI41847.1 hydrogenase accessory protein HypB [Streptomyces tsukubensis]